MNKGLKKFTVFIQGDYFDGGRLYGKRIKFAKSAEEACKKVQEYFNEHNDDEPIMHVYSVMKWSPEDKTGDEIYPFWSGI